VHSLSKSQGDPEVRGALGLVRPLAVVDQDEQQIPIGPLGDLFTARLLDAPVDAVYSLYGLGRTGGSPKNALRANLTVSKNRSTGAPGRRAVKNNQSTALIAANSAAHRRRAAGWRRGCPRCAV
jgi:hypothetical protein